MCFWLEGGCELYFTLVYWFRGGFVLFVGHGMGGGYDEVGKREERGYGVGIGVGGLGFKEEGLRLRDKSRLHVLLPGKWFSMHL
jgi:hypothetical protein